MARLVRHSWPGNVRELRNVIERACLLARGSTINLEDALVSEAAPSLGIRTDLPFKEAKGQLVEMFEREYIEDLMRRHKMNLSAAAREAQIDRKHLRELIRKYGLDPRHKLDGESRKRPTIRQRVVGRAAARLVYVDADADTTAACP